MNFFYKIAMKEVSLESEHWSMKLDKHHERLALAGMNAG